MRQMIILFIAIALLLCGTASAENDWVLTQYADLSGNQGMFYTIKSGDGLIIIDGGWAENAPQVKEVIEANGGLVTAWFLTHYHNDHAGAFNELWNEYRDRIGVVYCTPLIWDDFIEVAQEWDSPETYETFLKKTEGNEKIIRLHRDDELDIGDIHVEILNAYDEFIKSIGDIPNNCSLMIKMNVAGSSSILFCGDCHGKDLSNYLVERYGERLKADIVQAGHHGNNSMKTNFYKTTGMKIMLFDAPEWLMTGENYWAKNLKLDCDDWGVKTFDYRTAPNNITMNDILANE